MKYKYIGNETMRTTINGEQLLVNYGYEFDSDVVLSDDNYELIKEEKVIVEDKPVVKEKIVKKKNKKKFEEEEK